MFPFLSLGVFSSCIGKRDIGDSFLKLIRTISCSDLVTVSLYFEELGILIGIIIVSICATYLAYEKLPGEAGEDSQGEEPGYPQVSSAQP